LDAAHWAPSGDNAQPWTFEVQDDRHFDVCVRVAAGNVYEYRHGEPTLISAGTLLEKGETDAVFDFNHPLAGLTIVFEAEILAVM